MSLGVNLGVLSSRPSGDFASKMWSSYTQLNPGVYSDAIATEFKRRMKPDYAENLVPNGGGLNATDWLGAVGGLAQGFIVSNATPTIVVGNGFVDSAQRIATTLAGGYLSTPAISWSIGSSYVISFSYRSSAGVRLTNTIANKDYGVNTGDAITVSFTTTATAVGAVRFYPLNLGSGEWIEIDNLTITPTVSQNYFKTFGPSGLNKTTADWIGIMVTSSATAARTNAKPGAVMKWNMDGVVVTQNNLPAYTKGANAGIITFTSTDGFGGITTFDCGSCNLSHLSGLYNFTKLVTFYCYSNQLTSLTTHAWTKLITFYCNSNQLTSLTTHAWTDIVTFSCNSNQLTSLTTYAWTNIVNFSCHSNQLTSFTNFGANKISIDQEHVNKYSTIMVDSRLAYYNTMFAATPPIINLTLNLSGATMAIPTGAGSNTDLLGILAKFTAAGFTATIIVRTS